MHNFRQSGAREAQQEFDRELKLGPNRPSFGTCFASRFQRETRGPMIDANNDLEHAPSAVPLSQEARTIGRRRSGERDRSGARAAEQFAAGAQVRVKLGPRTASWCAGQEGTVISIGRQVEIDLGGRICKINPNELELLVSEELDASLLQLAEDMSLMAPAPSPPAPTPPAAEPNGAVRAAAAAEATVQSPRRRSPSSEERRQQQQGSATSAAAAAVHAGIHAYFRWTSVAVISVGALGATTNGRLASLVASCRWGIIPPGPTRVLGFVLGIVDVNHRSFDFKPAN
jgi:hypothetical protein